jgi:Recombination endonuclease VII
MRYARIVPAKGTRNPFCKNGHNKDETGREKSGGCRVCHNEKRRTGPRGPQRFCFRGHDKDITGRYKHGTCKACVLGRSKSMQKGRTAHWRLKHTGCSREQYRAFVETQQGCCAICGRHQREFTREMPIDHCHMSGQLRNILCHSCNFGLGNFKDNPGLLRLAATYLEAHAARILLADDSPDILPIAGSQ